MTPPRQVLIAPNLGAERSESVSPTRSTDDSANNSTISKNKGASTNNNIDNAVQHSKANDKLRRPKACTNCRRSKIKCIKEEHDQACKRCKAQGLQCLYEYKVASYKVANESENQMQQESSSGLSTGHIEKPAYLPSFSSLSNKAGTGVTETPVRYERIPPINRILNTLPAIEPNNHSPISRPNVSGGEQLQSIPRLLNPINGNSNGGQNDPSHSASSLSSSNSRPASSTGLTPPSSNHVSNAVIPTPGFNSWENSVEERLESFGSKLGAILSLLQNQQTQSSTQPEQHRLRAEGKEYINNDLTKKREAESTESLSTKRHHKASSDSRGQPYLSITGSENLEEADGLNELEKVDPAAQLKRVLSKEDARELFNFFNTNISPQLFGFDISKYSIDDIWSTCPLLIATIGCIASIHHPFLSHLHPTLEKIIYEISKDILFDIPNNETEAFNTIIALCFCGFWFKSDQMFTGLAIQLARTMNLISPHNTKGNKNSKIPKKERLKLWYLLYILDGQQSLVFNRQSMFASEDKILQNSRKLLDDAEKEDSKHEEKNLDVPGKASSSTAIEKRNPELVNASYADIRLISQVEYHQAINAVFGGHAWDLLTPSSFGLPFKTNLELDKWMVQWTVVLSPFKNHPVWSSKSTLIYYNFAKLHINSAAVRKYQATGMNLPNFDEIDDDFIEATEGCADSASNIVELNGDEGKAHGGTNDDDDASDDEDDDEEELDMAKELSPMESRKVSAELALSAAETVLNIVLGDSDILSVLRYVPIHIHIMLYYAAILILKPHAYLNDGNSSSEKFGENSSKFEDSLSAIKLVKRLRHSIIVNTPTDKEFANKIVEGLTNILRDKVRQMKHDIVTGKEGSYDQQQRLYMLDTVILDNDANELYNYQLKKNQNFKILAWPGFDAGHPTKSKGAE